MLLFGIYIWKNQNQILQTNKTEPFSRLSIFHAFKAINFTVYCHGEGKVMGFT